MALTMAMRRIGEGYLLSQAGAPPGARFAGPSRASCKHVRGRGPEICPLGLSLNPAASRGAPPCSTRAHRPLRNLTLLALLALVACGGGGDGTWRSAARGPRADGDADRAGGPLPSLIGTIAVTATASDDVAVTGVEFQIDGVTLGAVDTAAPYAATLDTSLYTSGQHVLRARASDASGNVSAWSTALVQFGGSVAAERLHPRRGLGHRPRGARPRRAGARRPDLRRRAGRRASA